MAQYDGSIRIGTSIEIKQAEKELKSLESSIAKTADKIASLRSKMDALKDTKIPTQEYKDIQSDISKAENELSKLLEKQAQMRREGKDSGAAWDRLNQKIQASKDYIDYAKIELQELVDSGKSFTLGSDTEQYAEMSSRMQELNQQMQSDTERQAELQSQIAEREEYLSQLRENAVVGNQRIIETVERIKQLEQEIADLKSVGRTEGYTDYDDRIRELSALKQEVSDYNNSTEQVKNSYVRLGESVKEAFRKISRSIIDIPIAAVKKGAQGLLNVFSRLGNTVKTGVTSSFRALGNVAKNAFSRIAKHANKSGSALSKFGGRIKEIVMSFFIFNQIRKIFTSTVNAIKEGFTNLYNDNLKFKSSVDNLKASLLTMKNSLATAFAPIVETAIPYIQRLVEWVTRAADSVGQLMAALMGRKTYTKAIKQSAAATEEAAEATEDETKAVNKQLSPLDKLNVLTSENAKENKKGKEADTGFGTMFEEVPISDKFKDIAKWLKDMWGNSDFYELGKFLGEKLKYALDSIPWDEIKEIARKIGKSLATLINGFVEVAGLGYSIGKTLIEAINTGFEFLNAFVHNLHWESIGKFIADTINGFFENIDWDLIYDTFVTGAKGLGDAINVFVDNLNWGEISNAVSRFINTFVDTIYTFVTTTDWKKLGEKIGTTISDAIKNVDWKKAGETVGEVFKAFFGFIATTIENIDWWAVGESVKNFLVGIDWAGVAESLFEAIGAALGGLAAFIGGLIGEGIENAKQYFQEKIEEAGGNIVEGIFVGIAEALVGIGNWIYEHILTPFLEGFKNAFGIHSPSTVMAEMGKYIIQGLLNGLKSTWETVTSWLQSKMQWLVNQIQSIFSLFSQVNTAARNMTSGKLGGFMGGGFKAGGRATVYSATPAYAALKNVELPQIPKLATGAVIPANREFLAVLGDQKHGRNLEMPEDLMRKIVREESPTGESVERVINLNLTVECEGYKLLQLMKKLDGEYFKQTGRHAFA